MAKATKSNKSKTKSTTKKKTSPAKKKVAKASPRKKTTAAAEGAHAKSGAKSPARRPLAKRTFFATKHATPESKWKLIDASGQTLGRLSSFIAKVLMGKDKPEYTRFTDTGDGVIVVNAEKIVLTGKKWLQKQYHYHTNFPGGIKTLAASDLRETKPERLIERAVYGMLPKGHMGRRWYGKLRVFAGANHPHTAQQPEAVTIPNLGAVQG